MANLVKIKDVYFYAGFVTPEGAADCVVAKQILDDAGIPYTFMHYGDGSQHPEVFQNLSTWTFGTDFRQETFSDFPFVHWMEYYDDYERCVEVAKGSAGITASNLLLNKDKIVTS